MEASWSLKLADGQSWALVAGYGTTDWLEAAAHIMGMKRACSECEKRVTFLRRRSLLEPPPGSVEKEAIKAKDEWNIEWFEPVCFFSKKGSHHLICELMAKEGEISNILGLAQAFYPVRLQAQMLGGLPLHAALLECSGKGIVIAAPSGTGKSTCSRRVPRPWKVLCDDETLIVRDALGKYKAHPFPTWSEYIQGNSNRSWNVQQSVPLTGIFVLQQSEVDFIRPLGNGEIAPLIYHSARQTYQRNLSYLTAEKLNSAKKLLFNNACQMAKSIPAYVLGVSLTGKFWELIEEVMEEPDRVV
jgi:SynChlorMet cassette protein ScmC